MENILGAEIKGRHLVGLFIVIGFLIANSFFALNYQTGKPLTEESFLENKAKMDSVVIEKLTIKFDSVNATNKRMYSWVQAINERPTIIIMQPKDTTNEKKSNSTKLSNIDPKLSKYFTNKYGK